MSHNPNTIDYVAAHKAAAEGIEQLRLIIESVNAAQRMALPVRRSRQSGSVVAAFVAEWFALPLSELKAKGRSAERVWARQVAMCLMREFTLMSTYDIEKFFRREHGCYQNAERAFKNRCETEVRTGADIAQLRQFINTKLK